MALAADPLAAAPPWSCGESCSRLLRQPQYGQPPARLPPLRPPGRRRHRDPPWRGCRARPGRGTDGASPSPPTATRATRRSTRGGAPIAVCEAARNVVAVGSRARSAVTNCLNFGNPENPEVCWQLREAIEGMRGGLPGARRAGGERQRQPVQRHRRGEHRPDHRHRHGGPPRGPRAALRGRFRARRRRGRAGRAGGDRTWGAASTSGWPTGATPGPGPPSISTWSGGSRPPSWR